MYLISPTKKQYKANLHSHSTFSDGERTPEELKQMYKDAGYSILAITDHEVPKSHSYLTDSDFLAITGYEAYIRPHEKGRFDTYNKEIHINLFARDPHHEAIVCYDPRYCKYAPAEYYDGLAKVGTSDPREYSVDYINEFVRAATEGGYLAAYNHPWWSMEDEATVLQYEGFFSIEMCNYGSYLESRLEYSGALYDKLWRAGKRIFCHSADDNHNRNPLDSPLNDSFGAFTMIMPDEFTYSSVIDAMEKGNMYSSMGPIFKEITVNGSDVHIECTDVARITMFSGNKTPQKVIAENGKTINSADFKIQSRDMYIRISICDENGRYADTRGFTREELGL